MRASQKRWTSLGILGAVGLLFGLTTCPDAGLAAEPADVQARLAKAPHPWTAPMHRITSDEYEATLRFWGERHPGILTVEKRAETRDKRPIYLLRITDRSVPDGDKQVALITSLHGGPERSGVTTILHLAEWLLGADPEAIETRRKQIVLLMPIVNPYAFFESDRFGNSPGNPFTSSDTVDPYTSALGKLWDLKTLTFTGGDKCPEVKAVVEVIDQYQPEVHADIHGIGLQEYPADKLGDRHLYRGQVMFESSGSAYSNYSLRPWDWRVIEAMVGAARAAGYGSDRFEADAQRSFASAAMAPIRDRFWPGQPLFYTAHYGYAKYHTMTLTMEIGWEESGVARTKGLLRLGNRVWEGEPVVGYPVDRVKPFIGHSLVARGRDSQERRQSRVELWQRQATFSQAALYPQTDCRDSYVVALSDQAARLLDADKAKFLANLKDRPGFRVDAIRAFFDDGPELKLWVDRGKPADSQALEHGLALRLRIPYRNPELVDLRLNGNLLEERPTDGYQRWYADGYTQVQIDLSPQAVQASGLVVVTCAYKPDVQRTYGWTPPAEVLQRLKAGPAKP